MERPPSRGHGSANDPLADLEAAVGPELAARGFERDPDEALSWARTRGDGARQRVAVDILPSGRVAVNLFSVGPDDGVHNAPVPELAARRDPTYAPEPSGVVQAGADLLGPGLRWLDWR